jgi:hypothetical protein
MDCGTVRVLKSGKMFDWFLVDGEVAVVDAK